APHVTTENRPAGQGQRARPDGQLSRGTRSRRELPSYKPNAGAADVDQSTSRGRDVAGGAGRQNDVGAASGPSSERVNGRALAQSDLRVAAQRNLTAGAIAKVGGLQKALGKRQRTRSDENVAAAARWFFRNSIGVRGIADIENAV